MNALTREQIIAARGRKTKTVDVPELEGLEIHGAGGTQKIDGTARLITPSAKAMLAFREANQDAGTVNANGLATLLASGWVDSKDRPRFTEAMAANLLDVISSETALFLMTEIMSLAPTKKADDAAGKAEAGPSETSLSVSVSP